MMRQDIFNWLDEEMGAYSDIKWEDARSEHDQWLVDEGCGPESRWNHDIMRYLHRAATLGLDTAVGRQALMKGMAVYVALAESMTRSFGDPPKPGFPSGEVR